MSIVKETQGCCSKCGTAQNFRVYRSINVAQDPELKAKVLDGSLFMWECPSCHQMNLARYETLYHDPTAKIMLWLLPGGEAPAAEMAAITLHAKAVGDYNLRMVSDIGSLIEKILIFSAGLDDVAVEMCKYVTKAEMAAKAGEEKAKEIINLPMHFYRMGEQDGQKYLQLSFPDNGKMVGCNIGFNVYEDCKGILGRNPHIKAGEGFAKVDSQWLLSVMQ